MKNEKKCLYLTILIWLLVLINVISLLDGIHDRASLKLLAFSLVCVMWIEALAVLASRRYLEISRLRKKIEEIEKLGKEFDEVHRIRIKGRM